MVGSKKNRKADFKLIEEALVGSYGYEPDVIVKHHFDKNNWYYTVIIKPSKVEFNHICKSVTMEDLNRLRQKGFILLGVWFDQTHNPETWSTSPRLSDVMFRMTLRVGRKDESHKWNLIY